MHSVAVELSEDAHWRDYGTASQRIARAEVERCGFSKLELNVVRSIYLRISGDCKTEASRKARSARRSCRSPCPQACKRFLAVLAARSDSSDKSYRCSKFVRQRYRG